MITILMMVALYHGQYKYRPIKIPANIIQATYMMGPSAANEKCLVALKKEYKGYTYLLSSETCDEIEKKVFDKK